MPSAADVTECPSLQPSRPLTLGQRAIGLYCRLPNGRVRVPSRDETRRFCLVDRWRDCPVYQRHAPR
jgi:hypothetical protein